MCVFYFFQCFPYYTTYKIINRILSRIFPQVINYLKWILKLIIICTFVSRFTGEFRSLLEFFIDKRTISRYMKYCEKIISERKLSSRPQNVASLVSFSEWDSSAVTSANNMLHVTRLLNTKIPYRYL